MLITLPNTIDITTNHVTREYTELLESVRGAMVREISGMDIWNLNISAAIYSYHHAISSGRCRGARARITKVAGNAAEEICREVTAIFDKVHVESSEISDFLNNTRDVITDLFCSMADRDILSCEYELRRYALYADAITASARDERRVLAAITTKRNEINSTIFKHKDRSGRAWRAEDYLYTGVRQALLGLYLNIFSFFAIKAGHDLVTVRHADEDKGEIVLTLTGATQGYPALAEVQSRVFHPRAKAWLEVRG